MVHIPSAIWAACTCLYVATTRCTLICDCFGRFAVLLSISQLLWAIVERERMCPDNNCLEVMCFDADQL